MTSLCFLCDTCNVCHASAPTHLLMHPDAMYDGPLELCDTIVSKEIRDQFIHDEDEYYYSMVKDQE